MFQLSIQTTLYQFVITTLLCHSAVIDETRDDIKVPVGLMKLYCSVKSE